MDNDSFAAGPIMSNMVMTMMIHVKDSVRCNQKTCIEMDGYRL